MRDDIDFLREITRPRPDFDAAHFVKEFINDDIQRLRNKSQQSMFHDYVRRQGYPIPNLILEHSSYVERPELQKRLKAAIADGENIALVGCEGGGKTTLIHFVVGSIAATSNNVFLYIDTSDFGAVNPAAISEILYDKLVAAFVRGVTKDTIAEFNAWILEYSDNAAARGMLDISTKKRYTEVFLAFLRITRGEQCHYLIIDNIDSISTDSSEAIFSSLKSISDMVPAICNLLDAVDHDTIRFIAACRTPTYIHISSQSRGLFADHDALVVQADDDFETKLSIVDLLARFVEKENEYIFKAHRRKPIRIPLPSSEATMTFEQYIATVLKWLKRSEAAFNDTIRMFSGRSVRRAKLYGTKVLGSPTIARLALSEEYGVFSVTRHDKDYLVRRIQEAIFEFPQRNRLEGTALVGFPMNPFRVIDDEAQYNDNPMIGVLAIDYLVSNGSMMSRPDVAFAKCIDVRSLVEFLTDARYSQVAIKGFFANARDSGLLRPVPRSAVLLKDEAEHLHVYELYILDNRARDHYNSLIFATDPKRSMIFYNSALRAHYQLGGDRGIDNMAYECFCCLLFMDDLISRESKLEKKMRGSGVMVKPMAARINGPMLRFIGSVLEDWQRDGTQMGRAASKAVSQQRAELLERTLALLQRVRMRVYKQSSII